MSEIPGLSKRKPKHERWLMSLADLFTLLFGLFAMISATAQGGGDGFKRQAAEMAKSFNKPEGPEFDEEGVKSLDKYNKVVEKLAIVPTETTRLGDRAEYANGPEGPAAEEEARSFGKATAEITQSVIGSPELSKLADGLVIDVTERGLIIQLVDQDDANVFSPGSANLLPRPNELLAKIGKVIAKLPNSISIEGHTDPSNPGDDMGYTKWELSSDRALAARRVLHQANVKDKQINRVAGRADRELRDLKNPRSPKNRRITLIVERGSGLEESALERLPHFLEKPTEIRAK